VPIKVIFKPVAVPFPIWSMSTVISASSVSADVVIVAGVAAVTLVFSVLSIVSLVPKTETQKDSLIGQLYDEDSYFNPIQDDFDNWIISVEEIDFCVNPEFQWVKDLPLIDYKPKPSPPFPPM